MSDNKNKKTKTNAAFTNIAKANGEYSIVPLNQSKTCCRSISAKDDITLDCVCADLKKTANKEYVEPGDEITYTITFTNESSVELYNVTIIDMISTKTTLVPNSIVPTPQQGQTLASGINIGVVKVGTSVSLVFKVTVNSDATGEIINTASATYNFEDSKKIQQCGCVGKVSQTVFVLQPKLEIEKTADKTYVSFQGEQVRYTIVVKNTGDVKIFNIIVTDDIPTGMAYLVGSTVLNDTLPSINQNPQTGIIIGNLDPTESFKIEFSVVVL